jgi:hypothetical protein
MRERRGFWRATIALLIVPIPAWPQEHQVPAPQRDFTIFFGRDSIVISARDKAAARAVLSTRSGASARNNSPRRLNTDAAEGCQGDLQQAGEAIQCLDLQHLAFFKAMERCARYAGLASNFVRAQAGAEPESLQPVVISS